MKIHVKDDFTFKVTKEKDLLIDDYINKQKLVIFTNHDRCARQSKRLANTIKVYSCECIETIANKLKSLNYPRDKVDQLIVHLSQPN